MELVNINIIRIQHFQAGFQILAHICPVLGAAFGGNHQLVAEALKGIAQLFLAVGVGPGGIEIIHASLKGTAQQGGGFLLTDTLNGQSPESVFFNLYTCAAKHDTAHGIILPR